MTTETLNQRAEQAKQRVYDHVDKWLYHLEVIQLYTREGFTYRAYRMQMDLKRKYNIPFN